MIKHEEIILRLVLSAILGGLIGLEREANNRPAGLRTHILVSVGSALIMLISMYGFDGLGSGGTGGEPARLAAQVVSGIGFLGAGTILRDGNNIKGLTTAASLWVCGGIGLAIGNGYYMGALVTTGIVLFSLVSLGFFEAQVFRSKYQNLYLVCDERVGLIGDVGTILGKFNIGIKGINIINNENIDEDSKIDIKLIIKTPSNFNPEALMGSLKEVNGVRLVSLKEHRQNVSSNINLSS